MQEQVTGAALDSQRNDNSHGGFVDLQCVYIHSSDLVHLERRRERCVLGIREQPTTQAPAAWA
jgi:hypothetical protein